MKTMFVSVAALASWPRCSCQVRQWTASLIIDSNTSDAAIIAFHGHRVVGI